MVTLKEFYRIATSPTLEESILIASAQKEGRDIPGRIAYYLMNVVFTDIAPDLVGLDTMESGAKQRGMARLGLNLANAFSDAACHNDARQCCDALSQSLFHKTKTKVDSPEKVEDTLGASLSKILSCAGEKQVLKLSNYANHSAVYLVAGNVCTKYESIAAPDSTAILYNDLIRYPVSESDLRATLKSGIAGIAQGGESELEWEVHQAASFEVLRERVYTRMCNSTLELSIGLALAAFEKLAEVRSRREDGTEVSDYGLTMTSYQNMFIPLECMNRDGTRVTLFNYNDGEGADVSALTEGDIVSARKIVGHALSIKASRTACQSG